MRTRMAIALSAALVFGALLTAEVMEASAAVPTLMTVQGKLTNPAGTPPSAGDKAFTFRIFSDSVGGTQVWPAGPGEAQTVKTDVLGLWTAQLGKVDPLTDAVFAAPARWLEVMVGAETLSRMKLNTNPYTYRVSTVDGTTGGTITGDVAISGKATIGPGHTNTGVQSFVAGNGNTVSGDLSVVAGGGNNVASGGQAAIGGGASNEASGWLSTVGGGQGNRASGQYGTVAGGRQVIAGGLAATVCGGSENNANGQNSFVGGGAANLADNRAAVIGGGENNRARGQYSVVAGGGGEAAIDTNSALGDYSSIGGGHGNAASGVGSAIGGGEQNVASGLFSAVVGGTLNSAAAQYAMVGGGRDNHTSAQYGLICGGLRNNIAAFSIYSMIVGGIDNAVGGTYGFLGGGTKNSISGYANVVAGGDSNSASGANCFVGGGWKNMASGARGTIPGGEGNVASGASTFAAGSYASALNKGAFVWADASSFSSFVSTADNEFSARCTGGARFVSAVDGTGNSTAGVQLAAGGGSWSSISDRNAKENIEPVDGAALLDKLSAIPVAKWNYRTQSSAVRHIGPMAQDFYAAFGVGEDDKHITTIDADGVALAAIQELYRQTLELKGQKTEIEQLRALVSQLQEQIEALKAQAKPAESR